MKIAVFSCKPYDKEYLEKANSHRHELLFLESPLNIHTVSLAQGCRAICCFVNDHMDAEVIEKLASMGIFFVALRCAGFNQVNVEAAKKFNVRVARVPEYSPHAVAEHALGLILMLNRHLHRAYNRVRENDYALTGLMGFDLFNKTVAVIGTGKIGRVFANIMLGLGCNLIAYDPLPDADLIAKGVKYLTLDLVWSQADIISLHCPLTLDTKHLINLTVIEQLKPQVMLINTSRGGLVDTQAVIAGLKAKKIGYLGLDVYEEEGDLFFEDFSNDLLQDDTFARLLTFPNVVITGHQAFFTKEALTAISEITLANINYFEQQQFDKVFFVV